jgi:hypothetical protein
MSKSSPKGKATPPKPAKGGKTSEKFVDRNLAALNPLKADFAPTDAEPVRQHFTMAGGC